MGVWSLVGEPRSHVVHLLAKKKKSKKEKETYKIENEPKVILMPNIVVCFLENLLSDFGHLLSYRLVSNFKCSSFLLKCGQPNTLLCLFQLLSNPPKTVLKKCENWPISWHAARPLLFEC